MGSAVLQYGHCSSDTARRSWAGRKGVRQGVQALGRRKAQAERRRARRRVQGAGGAQAGTRGAQQTGVQGARQACGQQARAQQGARAGYGLCILCTRPVFDLV